LATRPPSLATTATASPETLHAGMPGLFLAPASVENMNVTLTRAVSIGALEGRLDAETLAILQSRLKGASHFHCWAMTASSRGAFEKMKPGDIVLFTPKSTGR